MYRAILILSSVAAASVSLFVGGYQLAHHLCRENMACSTDDLAWLRLEFHLGDAEMARVRQLHEAYIPLCQSYCSRIAEKKEHLRDALDGGDSEAESTLAEIADIRAQCQAAMLRHFEEVSRAMPPEQGKRYLAEMRRLTLGYHEQIEESMAGNSGEGHAHHH